MTNISFVQQGKRLVATICGEVDQHTCASLRREIDARLAHELPAVLELDLQKVTFMDSSGIGLILGRYKRMSEAGGKLVVSRVSDTSGRVIGMSGITKILDITEEQK